MKRFVILISTFVILATPLAWFIAESIQYAVHGWSTDPVDMVAKIAFSFLFGQSIFWVFGYDQFGLFMNPKKQFGRGQRVAYALIKWVPKTPFVSWVIKIIEITTDAMRIPVEGLLFLKTGFVPDALATAITQPLWSTFEVSEKIAGTIIHPERVHTSNQVRLSLACIYGSVFRYGLALFLWFFGTTLYEAAWLLAV